VDHATEQELVRTLRARVGATRLIVSHRLSALEHADLVLVLDEGRLVDRGSHAELLSRPGPYRDAYDAQAAA
jgi:ATP-binding cassette, subfamily B, multidrug efflux pump